MNTPLIVLIVDDNRADARLLYRYLKEQPLYRECCICETGKEASEKLSKKIDEQLSPIFKRLSEDHKNYDILTLHGVHKKNQPEQRDLHRQQIQYYTDKLEEYESTRKR